MPCRDKAGRTEIQKLHPQAVRLIRIQHVDIVRCNITVQNTVSVNCLHSGSKLQNHRKRLLHRHIPILLQIRLQSHSFQIFHHNIGRTIFYKAVKNLYDSAYGTKLSQTSCLVYKPLQSLSELLCLLTGKCDHLSFSRSPCNKLTGKILLDRHSPLHRIIPTDIGNSKAAKSQHSAHNIAVVKHGARSNMVDLLRGRSAFIAAMRTDIITVIVFFHTSHA